MTDYNIEDSLSEYGVEPTEGESPDDLNEWIFDEVAAEQVRLTHPTGFTVVVKQRKPLGGDLPFRVVRETPNGDAYRLYESDWPNEAWRAAESFMLGFEEGYTTTR